MLVTDLPLIVSGTVTAPPEPVYPVMVIVLVSGEFVVYVKSTALAIVAQSRTATVTNARLSRKELQIDRTIDHL